MSFSATIPWDVAGAPVVIKPTAPPHYEVRRVRLKPRRLLFFFPFSSTPRREEAINFHLVLDRLSKAPIVQRGGAVQPSPRSQH